MSQDLVKALGVDVYKGRFVLSDGVEFVFVDDLRAALEKLPVVTGYQQTNGIIYWGDGKDSSVDTHTARLFAIEEIKREPVKVEVTKEQIAKAWNVMAKSNRNDEFNIFCKELGL